LSNTNLRVESEQDIKEILGSFKTITFEELDSSYLAWSKSDKIKYKKILSNSKFKVIGRNDFFKKIVGDFRIKDFVCKDAFYTKSINNTKNDFYPDGFKITYGHRHPKKNEQVKGASSSKHILGQAVDMVIYDINKDGKYTDEDKKIVLDIANKEVIVDQGGIGRYPGTRTVHIDVRGHRARWDSARWDSY